MTEDDLKAASEQKSFLNEDGSLKLEGKQIVLLLQGGGALGAYQVGAYEALAEELAAKDIELDWVGGISIGAINAAIIAGSKKGTAVANLNAMWKNDLLSPKCMPNDVNGWWKDLPAFLQAGRLAPLGPKYWDWGWTAYNPFGQQNFFSSRVMSPLENPWFRQWWGRLDREELAFYGTERLRETLIRYLEKTDIKTNGTRLSLGATRVTDGEVVFFNDFDSVNHHWPRATQLTVEHVLASGALPPAFPAIEIEYTIKNVPQKDWFWDGGLSTNTPIDALSKDLFAPEAKDTLVFLVDLFDRKGSNPGSLDEVLWRQKSIQFGSRKDAAEKVAKRYQLESEAGRIKNAHTLEICQIMFERPNGDPEFSFSDADFSYETFDKLHEFGVMDMNMALRKPSEVNLKPWKAKRAALYRYGTFGKHRRTDS